MIEDYEKLKKQNSTKEAKESEDLLQDEIQDKLVEEVFELKPDVNTTLVQIKANQLL